jgi:photosystem II stability/assembly factor-like uncharacterized protein
VRLAIIFLLSLNALAQWQIQDSHTKESLRGVSVVDENVVWASGTHGAYLLTTDGGKVWAAHQVSGGADLDFRGVKAFGAEAFLLAAGPGNKSRIYHTTDFGKHWDLQFTDSEPKGFLGCIAFSNPKHGIVVGDPVNGKFQILRTEDGGKSWRYADPKGMPAAIDGEGAFAASNSCIAINAGNAWFVTGGSAARVFHSSDGGENWSVADTSIVHGAPSQEIFSVAFKDVRNGVIAGGDYSHPDQGGNNLAFTQNGGKTWRPAAIQPQKYFSAVAYVRGGPPDSAIAAGSSGSALSKDGLHTWDFFLPAGFNAIDSSNGMVYAIGANGAVAKLNAK